jgi:hypothetical protein
VRVLFDQGTPVPLRVFLEGHEVDTAFEKGWQTLSNGELLARAEVSGYAAFVTTDRNLRYQQNLRGRRLAILVLMTTDWRLLKLHVPSVVAAVDGLTDGAYVELAFARS